MIFRLALRNVFRHRARSVVTLSAVAFGCFSMIFAGGFFADVHRKLQESYIKGQTGHLQVFRSGFFEHGRSRPFDYLIEDPDHAAALARSIPGVQAVSPRFEFGGLVSTGETSVAAVVQGVDPATTPSVRLADARDPKHAEHLPEEGVVIESGDLLSADHPYGAIIGRGLARQMGVKPGDGLIVVSRTVAGSINAVDVTVRGIFYSGSKDFDDSAIRLPLPTAQTLLRTESVQSFMILLDETDRTSAAHTALAAALRQSRPDLETKPWWELSDFVTKTQDLFDRMFGVLQLMIAVIVVFSIYNTMSMAVVERTVEIGTLMAIGSRAELIRNLFVAEGLVLGLAGGAAGALAGSVITWLIQQAGIPMPPPAGSTTTWLSEPMVVPSVVAGAIVLSIATALVSSLVPAWRAARLEPADALRHA